LPPSELLARLLGRYLVEGVEMPFDADRWMQEELVRAIQTLTVEQRLEVAKALPAEQRVEVARTLSPEQGVEVAKALPAKQRVEVARTLPPEQRLEGLTPEQRVAGLSAEQVEEILRRLKADPK
jgi:Mg/Co/Ni transporter MgtE